MYDVPGDFLLTYDPKCTEQHSDSSDFEDSQAPPTITPKNGNHSLVKKKLYTKSKKNLDGTCSNQKYTVIDGSSTDVWKSQTIVSQNCKEIIDLEVHQCYHNTKSELLDSGDRIQTIKSKRSLIRHKVIPCLSSMFGRSSNNVKQMSIIRENHVENVNIDNGCQPSRVNCAHKMRKFNRRQQCYAVQPVYAVEGNIHAKSSPFQRAKIVQEPLLTCKTAGVEYCNGNYSLTSSSDGIDTQQLMQRKKGKVEKSKHLVEPNLQEDYVQHYEGPNLKTREQQCHSRQSRKTPYQVYTTPYAYQRTNTGCSPIDSNKVSASELPSTCSGFWDYLINKINSKYQGQGSVFRPCRCNSLPEDSAPCTPGHCENNPAQTEPPDSSFSSKPAASKLTRSAKVDCKCHKYKSSPPPLPPSGPMTSRTPTTSQPPPFSPEDSTRPCQLTHDEITGTLTQKYNGEILCIHNPPCVLINGCLNLPPPKEEMTADLWPVTTQDSGCGYQHVYRKKCATKQQSVQYGPSPLEMQQCRIMDESCQYFPPGNNGPQFTINDESCQYRVPSTEIKQLMITDESCQYGVRSHEMQYNAQKCQETSYESCQYLSPVIEMKSLKTQQVKEEKIIQSICNHIPPCEVVRTCFKPKFDPKLQNSCVHVPMCEKVPLCLMELKSQNQTITECQHKPKCAEVPICTRNYIVLTAKEEAATQVRPKAKMVCRHEPPCIMIPKCLARICDSYIPYDAIPDCVHQPMCEMIPACCRKSAKEMVSVCSQYPNQCCIV